MLDRLKQLFQLQQATQQDGLLKQPQATGGLLGGLTSNPNLILGASIIGQGVKGKDPFSSVIPALTETGKIQKMFTPKIPKTKEVYDTKTKQNVLASDRMIATETGRYIAKQDGGAKISRDQVKNLQGLFTQNSIVKDFNMASTQFSKLTSSAKQESAAGDMSMIFTYMKILDPTSVVREGEQATAKNAAGVPDLVRSFYNKANTGEKLSPTQRKDFVKTGAKLYNSNIKQFDAFKNSFGSSIEKYGLDSSEVFLSGDLRPKQIQTKEGKVIDSSKAQLIDYDMVTGEMVYILPGGMKFRIKK
jgi:hypothetical protein